MCFLALVLKKALEDRIARSSSWPEIIRLSPIWIR
jgi:hypothetical protein